MIPYNQVETSKLTIERNIMKHTILIVDDSLEMRNSLSNCFSCLGHDVIVAESGDDGWRAFRKNKTTIDRVLTDYEMTGIDGIDGITVIKCIRRLDQNMVTCLMSGNMTSSLRCEALQAGATSTFSKGNRVSLLLEALNIGLATDSI